MSHKFCAMPWNHLHVRSQGDIRICCASRESVVIDGKEANVKTHSARDIFNSEYMLDIRKSLSKGKWPSACKHCEIQENNNIPSLRAQFNNQYLTKSYNFDRYTAETEISNAVKNNFVLEQDPTSIQLEVGNLCNLKCRMCNPHFSSQIQRDPVHGKWFDFGSNYQDLLNSNKWYESPELIINQLVKDPGKLKYFSVIGGEPLLSKSLKEVLIALADAGVGENLMLQMTTNGVSFTEDWYEVLGRYKNVFLTISIDGIENEYEYIRAPAKWKTIVKNIPRILKLSNGQAVAAPTIQAYNAMSLVEMYRTFNDLGLQPCPFTNILESPDFLGLKVLPMAARKIAANRLKEYLTSDCPQELHDSISRISECLDGLNDEDNFQLMKQFMIFTNDLDKSRNQNFKETHPELFQLFLDSGFNWTNETRFAS